MRLRDSAGNAVVLPYQNKRNRAGGDTGEAVGTGVGAVAGGAMGNKMGERANDNDTNRTR